MGETSTTWENYKQDILYHLGDFSSVYSDLHNQKCSTDGWVTALCPFHPDSSPSFAYHVPTGNWKCHAGCGEGSVFDFIAQRDGKEFVDVLLELGDQLGLDRPRKAASRSFEKVYNYRDADGQLLYQVIRGSNKKFRQRRPDGNGGWIWNLKDTRRVLYRLPDLLARPDETVFIVEGEKDADRLRDQGLLATTNPAGSGKWRTEYNETLRGRDIVILPDNDTPGRDHAKKVAASLHGIAAKIKIVSLSGLPEKGDISDWLDAGYGVSKLQTLVSEAAPWCPSEREATKNPSATPGHAGHGSLAKQIVDIVLSSDITLFHDQRKEPYTLVGLDGQRRTIALDSKEMERLLSKLAWKHLERAPSKDALSAARNVLASHAVFDGREYPLHVRIAEKDGAFWIDVDGSKAVRVTADGWQVDQESPVLFRPFPHQQAMPTPVPGGDPWRLREFVNLSEEQDVLLLLCYLVAAMVPNIPVPAIIVHGAQGSAKTSLLKIIKSLLDPSVVEVVGSVRNLDEFSLVAFQHRALMFDNLSAIPQFLSDALCRAVTGEGYMKRKLYSDADATVFSYRRVVGLSGVNNVADKPDLLDRAIILSLAAIDSKCRREEKEFWSKFTAALPEIYGGLLDTLVNALQVAADIELAMKPRMADFSRWGAAAAVALGKTPEQFMVVLNANTRRQTEAAVDSSPIAQAVIALMDQQAQWSGTPRELLDQLILIAETEKIDTRAKTWPMTASWVTRRLKEVGPTLLSLGLQIDESRAPHQRLLSILRVEENAVIAVIDSQPQVITADRPMTAKPDAVITVINQATNRSNNRTHDDSNDSNDSILNPVPSYGVIEDFEERAAIMEYEGGLVRLEAEERAAISLGIDQLSQGTTDKK